MDEPKYIRTSLYIEEDLKNEVQAIADAENRSWSFIFSTLAKSALKERERQRLKNRKKKPVAESNS